MAVGLKSNRDTYVGKSVVLYKGTPIVSVWGDHAELRSVDYTGKDWRTLTTKSKMNLALTMFNFNWSLASKDGVWYVVDGDLGVYYLYQDGILLPKYGGQPHIETFLQAVACHGMTEGMGD